MDSTEDILTDYENITHLEWYDWVVIVCIFPLLIMILLIKKIFKLK